MLAGGLAQHISAAGRPLICKECAVVFFSTCTCSAVGCRHLSSLACPMRGSWFGCTVVVPVGESPQEGTVASVCPWKHRSSDGPTLAPWHLMCSLLCAVGMCGGAASTKLLSASFQQDDVIENSALQSH